ncbi:YfcE family phosphodiesterase [Salimicrobium jeotgali]|uniref:Metallophosphoesterase n=1 Tax=Salimicrobium jeotgali TaxID=1230341 RepID=K2GJB8_9BACI|nr:metallophosphoesterase family protein [Salimicrobium jeotgali]AKG04806.1 YfcE family phosphodiesterase [Salimicrobium jeotgali]EKE30549.1 metallophosphoesterase [Salimicrobium jeotgali]MBM7696780.1 putative phosphoesterase [Salimicrobium jeotgali]
MKTAFIADIHGNATALQAVLDDIKRQGADRVVMLGDLCYRGPEPKKSLDLIRNLDAPVIKGNADAWITRGVRDGEVPEKNIKMMREEREWVADKLTEEDISYLKNLPESVTETIGEKDVYCVHATPDSLFDVVKPDTPEEQVKEEYFDKKEADVYLYGHIHLPYVRPLEGKVIANTGSVGLPFDSDPRASYLIVSENSMELRKVSYDVEEAVNKLYENDYPQADLVADVYRSGSL